MAVNHHEPLKALIEALCELPGVGERTAQRMAYQLLQYKPEAAMRLSQALEQATQSLRHCDRCNTFTAQVRCHTCQDYKRDASQLCIVETPADQNLIENSGYRGLYYVLMGAIKPVDGVGPKQLDFEKLLKRVREEELREVIIATNFTAEGDLTAHHLGELLKNRGLKISRIARGIPVGSELEYVDASTVAWAFFDRKDI